MVIAEIYLGSKRGLRLREAPVKCFYTKYSKARGTTIASGIRIFWGLILQKIRS